MSSYSFAGIVHDIVEDSKSILEDLLYSVAASTQLSPIVRLYSGIGFVIHF